MASGTKNKPFKIVCDAFHNVLLTVIIASGGKSKSPLRVMSHVILVYAIIISKSRQGIGPSYTRAYARPLQCLVLKLRLLVPAHIRCPLSLILLFGQEFRFERSQAGCDESVQLKASSHQDHKSKADHPTRYRDSHDPRPSFYQSHPPHVHPEGDHRTAQYRAYHFKSHRIQLGAELGCTDGKNADGEGESPPAHVEADFFSAHEV